MDVARVLLTLWGGGTTIRPDFNLIAALPGDTFLAERIAQLAPDQKRAAALSAIIEIKIMANKAKSSGLDQDAAFKRKLEFLNERALHAEVIDKEIAPQVTDEAIKARYEKEIAGQPQVE